MPSARGVLVLCGGLALWIVARIVGSPTIHVVAVGLCVLPAVAFVLSRRSSPAAISVRRRISDVRVPPGRRVTVDLEVENGGATSTSFLMIEDRVPPALGAPARLVLPGLPPHARQHVSYHFTPHARGRFVFGPLSVDASDPFGLIRRRAEFPDRDELVVTPEVEDLGGPSGAAFGSAAGLSKSRNLFRTGEEFYTMRAYQEGDDLRRIHWPSVARRGSLMIRQDESSRRGNAVLFVDTRSAVVGEAHSPSFERCVSAAASIGVLFARAGFSLRYATAGAPLLPAGEEELLDALAALVHDSSRAVGPILTRLRAGASADATLVAITAPPTPAELPSLVRAGSAFGPKLAVLVYPIDPTSLPPERASMLEGRASQARLTLSRSGWDVLVLRPSSSLKELWPTNVDRRSPANAFSR
jgi:uncharacterized protein (DUF58 family)